MKTSVIFFKRGGSTKEVLFLNVSDDGYRMDSNHDLPIDANDLPELVDVFKTRDLRLKEWKSKEDGGRWSNKWWFTDIEKIRSENFNLSASRYKPFHSEKASDTDPIEVIDELLLIEHQINESLLTLKNSLLK